MLQVNRSPSFRTNEPIDFEIKSLMLEEALKLVNIPFAATMTTFDAPLALNIRIYPVQ